MGEHIDIGYMCLDAIRSRYRIVPFDIGDDALMKAKGMMFTTESYEVEGFGHLCVLRMKAFAGLMKMETVVLAPEHKDMPLLNIDWVSAFGSETQIVELYDIQLEDYPAEYLDAFAKIKDRDSDIPEYRSGDHWYDDIKYACSYSKKDRKGGMRFNTAAESYLKKYLEQAGTAKTCEASMKKALTRSFAEQLISQGGPAVDQVTKLFGEDVARRLIMRHMYGADE